MHTDYYLQVVMVITSKISMKVVVLDILMADTKTCGKIDGPLQCNSFCKSKICLQYYIPYDIFCFVFI